MAKSPRATTSKRGRRTVREELSDPTPATFEDSATGEESMSEFHDNETPTPKAASVPRLSLPLTPDGSAVDWERVRNAEKARTVLGLNGASEASGAADGLFGADMLGLALDMLSTSLVSTFKAAGYTVDSAEATRLTDTDKAALIPRYEKILSKHAPALGKYEDEIMAGVTTLIVFGGKMMLLKRAGKVTQFPRAVESPTPEPASTTPVITE